MKTPCTKIISAIISLAFLYLSPGQSAETGDREIQIGGGFFLAQGDAATGTAQFEAAYSYMWTPNWQVGARQLASYGMNDPIEDVWTGSTTGFINYYPWGGNPDRQLQPFLGTFLGLGYSDVDVSGTAGPTIGLKFDISDAAFFVTQYRYEAFFTELDAGGETDDFDNGNHIFTMGLGLRW